MQALLGRLTDKQAMEVVSKVEDVFKNVPHLPESWSKFLAKVAPWLALLGGIVNVVGGLSSLVNRQMSYVPEFLEEFVNINPSYFVITGLISLVTGALLLLAFSPLRKKELAGWVYLFWVAVVGVVESIVTIVMAYGSIIGSILGLLIGFYLLFEIKPWFKK